MWSTLLLLSSPIYPNSAEQWKLPFEWKMPLKSYIGRLCFLSFLNPLRDSVSIAHSTHPHSPSLRYNLLCRRVRFFPYLKQFRARNYLRKYQCQHPFRTLNKAQHNRPPTTSSQPVQQGEYRVEVNFSPVPTIVTLFTHPHPASRVVLQHNKHIKTRMETTVGKKNWSYFWTHIFPLAVHITRLDDCTYIRTSWVYVRSVVVV